MKEFETRLERIDSDLWQNILRVPVDIAQSFIDGDNRRIICHISTLKPFHCALMHDGNNGHYIMLNQVKRKKLGVVQGEVISVKIQKDDSELGMPMSSELSETLNQFELARERFNILTPGKKRSLIYWADNVKSSDIKIRRAIVLCNHLEARADDIDFRELNEEMKKANALAKRS